jgi:hypothetical protein
MSHLYGEIYKVSITKAVTEITGVTCTAVRMDEWNRERTLKET